MTYLAQKHVKHRRDCLKQFVSTDVIEYDCDCPYTVQAHSVERAIKKRVRDGKSGRQWRKWRKKTKFNDSLEKAMERFGRE